MQDVLDAFTEVVRNLHTTDENLEEYFFGYCFKAFGVLKSRLKQREAVQLFLGGMDTFVSLPTDSGKKSSMSRQVIDGLYAERRAEEVCYYPTHMEPST